MDTGEVFLLNGNFFRAQRVFDKSNRGNAAGFAHAVGGQVVAGMKPVADQTNLFPFRSGDPAVRCNITGTLNTIDAHGEVPFAECQHVIRSGIIHCNGLPGFQKPLNTPVPSDFGNFAGWRSGVVRHGCAAHVSDIHFILSEGLVSQNGQSAEQCRGS